MRGKSAWVNVFYILLVISWPKCNGGVAGFDGFPMYLKAIESSTIAAMEEGLNVDRIMQNRTFLFESCSDVISDIKSLKCGPVLETVKLVSSLSVCEDDAFEFTSTLVIYSICAGCDEFILLIWFPLLQISNFASILV